MSSDSARRTGRGPAVAAATAGGISANLRGALWILLSCAAATGMSLGVKGLAGSLESFQVTFVRCAAGLILLLPFALGLRLRSVPPPPGGAHRWISRRWPVHVLRGVLAGLAINCGYYALAQLPLATATVLFFTAPLFVTILAGPLLGERVGWRRWSATGVGLIGTVIVMRPAASGFDPAMLVAVGSSVFFAGSLIIGKRLSATESHGAMLFYSSAVTTVVTLPPGLLVWTAPSLTDWGLLGVVTLFATARTYADIRGYAAGEASFVAPFQYLRIVLIGVSAYLIFQEVPDGAAIAGAVVIVASSLYIAQRETRHSAAPTRPAGPSPD